MDLLKKFPNRVWIGCGLQNWTYPKERVVVNKNTYATGTNLQQGKWIQKEHIVDRDLQGEGVIQWRK